MTAAQESCFLGLMMVNREPITGLRLIHMNGASQVLSLLVSIYGLFDWSTRRSVLYMSKLNPAGLLSLQRILSVSFGDLLVKRRENQTMFGRTVQFEDF